MKRWMVTIAIAWGCGSEERPRPEPIAEPEVREPPPAEITAYEIHEWGLIDVELPTQATELAAGPGVAPPVVPRPRPDPGMGVGRPRKPVLYFHLRDASPDFRFDLTVHLGVPLVEHWPEAIVTNDGALRWENVALSSEHCAGEPFPTAGDPRCARLGSECELALLATYATDDSGCLRVGDAETNLLFYRASGTAPPLPVTIARGEVIELRNDSMSAPAGAVLRLVQARRGAPILVSMASMPTEGASVSLPRPTEPASDAHRAAISEQLRALGMTPSEAAAFERAWFPELFDGSASTPHAFSDAVLFFLSASEIDPWSRLEASPPPAIVHRAMAVRAGWR